MFFRRYEQPETEEEAAALLEAYGGNGRILAGGTDLVVKMRKGLLKTDAVIDIGRIQELGEIRRTDRGLEIGAAVRLSVLEDSRALTGAWHVLSECAGHVSSIQVRNMATVGGNSCNASPSADTAPAMLLLDARARIRSGGGYREEAMESFYRGPGKTILGPEDLLIGFLLPPLPEHCGTAYCKYAIRGDSDISIVGAGARLDLDGEMIRDVRLAFASVGPKTLRLKRAEEFLKGKQACPALFEEAARICAADCTPITDQRATEGYRRKMTALWAARSLEQAYRNAKKTAGSAER